VRGDVVTKTIPYDYLVCAVGAETQTFGIPGVKEHAVFMKELGDAEKVSSGTERRVEIRLIVFAVPRPCHGL